VRGGALPPLALALALEAWSEEGPPPDACGVCGHTSKLETGECSFCGAHVCRGGTLKLGPAKGCCR